MVVGISKFTEGAWITVFLIPALVVLFSIGFALTIIQSLGNFHFGVDWVLPLESALLPHHCSRLRSSSWYYERDRFCQICLPGRDSGVRRAGAWGWAAHEQRVGAMASRRAAGGRALDLSFYHRTIVGFSRQYRCAARRWTARHSGLARVCPGRGGTNLLHNQTAWLIKAALLYRRRHLGFQRVIVDVPHHLQN